MLIYNESITAFWWKNTFSKVSKAKLKLLGNQKLKRLMSEGMFYGLVNFYNGLFCKSYVFSQFFNFKQEIMQGKSR